MEYLDNIIKACQKISEEFQDFEKSIKKMNDIYNAESEPAQPIIKKSGETWVARFDGVDYLCIAPEMYTNEIIEMTTAKIFIGNVEDLWKPISEIELTDEIAKLRPMVIDGESLEILLAIHYNILVTNEDRTSDSGYRITTIDDLP